VGRHGADASAGDDAARVKSKRAAARRQATERTIAGRIALDYVEALPHGARTPAWAPGFSGF